MALMATLLSRWRGQNLLSWELVRRGSTFVKTVNLAAQEEGELARAPQEIAQPLVGEEHVAGVDYNDESDDVEVDIQGSQRPGKRYSLF